MEWDYKKCFIIYNEALEYLKGSVGISQLDINLDREVLLPYYTVIIKYLNSKLITLGSEDIKAKVELIFNEFNQGADLICDKEALTLANEIGIDSSSENYDQDRFVFSWTNLMSTLTLRLKFQYIHLFKPDYDGECCKCGKPGETTRDWESWRSDVYSEDEDYDRTNYARVNSSWQVNKDRYCDCYRRDKQDEGDINK